MCVVLALIAVPQHAPHSVAIVVFVVVALMMLSLLTLMVLLLTLLLLLLVMLLLILLLLSLHQNCVLLFWLCGCTDTYSAFVKCFAHSVAYCGFTFKHLFLLGAPRRHLSGKVAAPA